MVRFRPHSDRLPDKARVPNVSQVNRSAAIDARQIEVTCHVPARPGRLISPILLALGWKRKRRWSSTGQYHRYRLLQHS